MAGLLGKADVYMTAVGGLAPPAVLPYHDAWALDHARIIHEVMPDFRAWEYHFWGSSAEAWAWQREKELRDERLAREAERELARTEWPW